MAETQTNKRTETLQYYEKNAEKFVQETVSVPFRETQEKFLTFLKDGAYILDFGCGSGRDTRFFSQRGFRVDAVDGSEKMCEYARKYSGIKARQMMFMDLDAVEMYDGIWACSSILHLSRQDLAKVLERMGKAVRQGGVAYASFKYGDFEGMRRGRWFVDFTEQTFSRYMKNIPMWKIEKTWITTDVRPARGGEKWLNIILRKTAKLE